MVTGVSSRAGRLLRSLIIESWDWGERSSRADVEAREREHPKGENVRNWQIAALIVGASLACFGCQRSAGTADNAGSARSQVSSSSRLTNDRVQRAVDKALDWTKKGGGAQVVGIQEIPQENSARADIQFSGFQYNSDDSGIPVPKERAAPRKPDPNTPNFYQELLEYGTRQVHAETYSGQGVATLKHYNDGRWVLTGVHWGFHGTNATVEVQ